jgi:hypothetical protein
MAVTITDNAMTSDLIAHRAEFRPHAAADGRGAWIATRMSSRRLLTRDQAVRAMVLAELAGATRLRRARSGKDSPRSSNRHSSPNGTT